MKSELMNQSSGGKILDKAEVIARTVMSQQPFYKSIDCNENHRQLLETMVGAAIWYLPQGKELWTGKLFRRGKPGPIYIFLRCVDLTK